MSGLTSPRESYPTGRGLGYGHIRARWGWFVALGAAMLLAGAYALVETELVTIVSVVFIGAALIVGGVSQMIHAFATKGWGAFLLNLLCGALYVVGGALIVQEPVSGSVLITMFLSVALVVGGVLRMVIALRHREIAGWWLLALGGLFAVFVGLMLYAGLPWSGLWLLGTLIGIELVVQGVSWLVFGFSLRRLAV